VIKKKNQLFSIGMKWNNILLCTDRYWRSVMIFLYPYNFNYRNISVLYCDSLNLDSNLKSRTLGIVICFHDNNTTIVFKLYTIIKGNEYNVTNDIHRVGLTNLLRIVSICIISGFDWNKFIINIWCVHRIKNCYSLIKYIANLSCLLFDYSNTSSYWLQIMFLVFLCFRCVLTFK